ncbi:hypothetical protein J6590_055643 [Homalodisca vitripennis]|nr:hypothetical protein J6590_055643 [Homalodisca vitripennis]
MNVISAFGIVSSKGSLLTSFVKLLYPMIISSTPIVAVVNALWRYNRSFPKYFEYLQKADWCLKKEIYYLTKQRRVFFLSHRFDCFFWLLKSLVRFACPLIISELTTKAAEKSLEILHNYSSQSLTKATSEEIHYFCQEIASRDLTISSAFNLFVLKAELITAAVAACTTYIVILVQLHTT